MKAANCCEINEKQFHGAATVEIISGTTKILFNNQYVNRTTSSYIQFGVNLAKKL